MPWRIDRKAFGRVSWWLPVGIVASPFVWYAYYRGVRAMLAYAQQLLQYWQGV